MLSVLFLICIIVCLYATTIAESVDGKYGIVWLKHWNVRGKKLGVHTLAVRISRHDITGNVSRLQAERRITMNRICHELNSKVCYCRDKKIGRCQHRVHNSSYLSGNIVLAS